MHTTNTLILPVCGQSTRFPGVRPKWLLTHPNGYSMLRESIEDLDLAGISRIIITCLASHVEENDVSLPNLSAQFENLGIAVEFLLLDEPTASQVETVRQTIVLLGIDGPIWVKDCDNKFVADLAIPNYMNAAVSFSNLENHTNINPSNKSYILIEDDFVVDAIEKQVISKQFITGLYFFISAAQFLEVSEEITTLSGVVKNYIDTSCNVGIINCEDYHDWGTLEDWLAYTKTYQTIFCDIDGVLLENSGTYCGVKKEGRALRANIDAINKLIAGNSQVILTTSRPPSRAQETYNQLRVAGLTIDNSTMIIFGVYPRRLLINDFSPTNPYPACRAINLPRNSDTLKDYL